MVPSRAVASPQARLPGGLGVAEGVLVVGLGEGSGGVGFADDGADLVVVKPPVGRDAGRGVDGAVAQDVAHDVGSGKGFRAYRVA
jgi:hypothetical protein